MKIEHQKLFHLWLLSLLSVYVKWLLSSPVKLSGNEASAALPAVVGNFVSNLEAVLKHILAYLLSIGDIITECIMLILLSSMHKRWKIIHVMTTIGAANTTITTTRLRSFLVGDVVGAPLHLLSTLEVRLPYPKQSEEAVYYQWQRKFSRDSWSEGAQVFRSPTGWHVNVTRAIHVLETLIDSVWTVSGLRAQ